MVVSEIILHPKETDVMPVQYPKRTLKKNLNSEKLVVAAATLFSRNGHMSTTLNDVARHAGVHVQTLYKHFKTKEELAIASAEVVVKDCTSLSDFTKWNRRFPVTPITQQYLVCSKKFTPQSCRLVQLWSVII